MQKSKVKIIVKNAMRIYYEHGFTNTAYRVYKSIINAIDKAHSKRPKR
jgi:hypothetical protein